MKIRQNLISCLEIAATILLAYILLLFSTGIGQIGFISLQPAPLSLLLIIFFALLLIRLLLKHRFHSKEELFSSPGTMLFCFVMIVYLSNGRTIGSVDTIPARYLPVSILRDGDFYLDEFPNLYSRNAPKSLRNVGGHFVSAYPVGAPLLALPFYAPSAVGPVQLSGNLLVTIEKIAASCLTALSVVVIYFSLLFLTDRKTAFLLSLVYAFCTSSFSISSQALWQHGPSQLALASTVYCFLRGRLQPEWIGYAGFPVTVAVVCRPTDAVIAMILGVYVLVHHRQQLIRFLIFSIPPLLFQLWYNLAYFQDPFHTQFPVEEGWTTPWSEGILRSLFSPAKGLLVYSPVFLFSIAGMIAAWSRRKDWLLRYLTIAVVALLLLFGKWRGAGGTSWGPRHLADLAPMLTIFLVPAGDFLQKKLWKIVFLFFCGWSVFVHAIGAFAFDIRWYDYFRIREHPERLWMVKNNPIFFTSNDLWNRCILHFRNLPTSRNAPNLLAAAYRSDVPEHFAAASGEELRLRLEAVNTGRAVWLAEGEFNIGRVVLLGLWSKSEEPVKGMAVKDKLLFDVFPGEASNFEMQTRAPIQPGTYTFTVGLISQRISTFSKLGSPNMEFIVVVGSSEFIR